MSKKATVIWRYILGALIIVLSVVMIIGLTSCESVDTDDYQETITDESEIESETEAKTESETESKTESKPETDNIPSRKAKGMIMELYNEQIDGGTYYFFKFPNTDNWYRFLVMQSDNNPIILELGMEVSIEYVQSVEDGICVIQKIYVHESEEEIIQTQKVEGIIEEIYKEPSEDCNHYLFKLEGSDNLYKFFSNNPSILNVGMGVSIEYLESAEEGIYIVEKIQRISF